MGFVFEKVPEEDWDFFMSMGLKDCWGSNSLNVFECSAWCADRECNAYLVPIGGGFREIDGTVLDSGVIPVMMVDTEINEYYQITEAGKWLIVPYGEDD